MTVAMCAQCGALSASAYFCDDCGARLEGKLSEQEAEVTPHVPEPAAAMPVPPAQATATSGRTEWLPELLTCPEERGGCGAARQTTGPFCKLCGFNFRLLQPATFPGDGFARAQVDPIPSTQMTHAVQRGHAPAEPPPSVALKAVVSCDPDLYHGLHPQDRQELKFPASELPTEFLIRAPEVIIGRPSRQPPALPQIVISTDPGVSRQHATLLRQEDGGYAILDVSSAGGTLLNGQPIQGKMSRLKPGDVLVMGAWTRIDILAC